MPHAGDECLIERAIVGHTCQRELFLIRVRARAIGFVYTLSQMGAMISGFLIAFCLREFGTIGVFTLIVGCMTMVVILISGFGSRTRGYNSKPSRTEDESMSRHDKTLSGWCGIIPNREEATEPKTEEPE